LLHDDSSRGDLIAMANVAHPQLDEIAASELAVDAEIEQCELANPAGHLRPNPQRPNVLQLERRLLTNDLSIVPWLTATGDYIGFHDGLLVQLRADQHTPSGRQLSACVAGAAT